MFFFIICPLDLNIYSQISCPSRFHLSIEELRVSGMNVLDAPHLSSCLSQIVCQCALAQVPHPYRPDFVNDIQHDVASGGQRVGWNAQVV